MNHSDSVVALAVAMAKAQGAMTDPKRTSENPYFKSKYADLGEVVAVSRASLAANGLSVVQTVASNPEVVAVTTTLLHESGQWMTDTASFPLGDKTTIQQVGSVVTYLRRYSLMAILGLAPVDDDGNSGPEVEKPPVAKPVTPVAPEPPPRPDDQMEVIREIKGIIEHYGIEGKERDYWRTETARATTVEGLVAVMGKLKAAEKELMNEADKP